ncbi:DUF962 domain-containing protein [Sediminitomix flava]|uniref:DUF962 domain-containing protein n=1 Tax=Sediminitomix flava TaxID=379075 RepID=A0A315Z844_SEDFL|nr:DUF962 domain-containing protein [Sediminitomix flava]PWJ39206.1 hypothetical protein BC781_106107 [Sediminitomix flava]
MSEKKYKSFKEFYPYYLAEHSNTTCRTLHFIGTFIVFIFLGLSVYLQNANYLWGMPLAGYGFAWVGHAFFEKNKPATFTYPFYSLASDFVMFFDLLRGKEKFIPLNK